MAKFVFLGIGVLWGAMGLWMLLFPTLWRSSMGGRLGDPGFRFLLLQGIVLAGLILIMGTTGFQGFELWVAVGGLGIGLASFILGCSPGTRNKLVHAVEQWPLWLYRVGGLMMMSLAVLFGADLILSGF